MSVRNDQQSSLLNEKQIKHAQTIHLTRLSTFVASLCLSLHSLSKLFIQQFNGCKSVHREPRLTTCGRPGMHGQPSLIANYSNKLHKLDSGSPTQLL